MSTRYDVCQLNRLADALERAGFTPEHVRKLGQDDNRLVDIRRVLDGFAVIELECLPAVRSWFLDGNWDEDPAAALVR